MALVAANRQGIHCGKPDIGIASEAVWQSRRLTFNMS
nr:MAG TPA: hypothetical protein [Caudoviricetes sp.]